MSLNGKKSVHFSKKDLSTQKQIGVGFKKLKFYHAPSTGATEIDLLNLTLPASGIPASATNPSAGDLAAAKLLFNKDNLILISSYNGLLDFDDYTIDSNTKISLKDATVADEIFVGIVDHVAKTGLTVVDNDPIVATGTLAASADEFVVGKPFDLNKYPTTQQGAVMVFLDGQLMARNVNNAAAAPGADGDYQEVGTEGIGNLIKFNETSASTRSVMVISSGLSAAAPSDSLVAQIESVAGQVDAMVPVLASTAGVPENTFQTAPSSVDLRNFGDRMLDAEGDISSLSEGGDAANGPLLATSTVAGAVTSYAPDIANSAEINASLSSDITISADDGRRYYFYESSAASKAITLPAASACPQKEMTFVKTGNTGELRLLGSFPDGRTDIAFGAKDSDHLTVVSDGSVWRIISGTWMVTSGAMPSPFTGGTYRLFKTGNLMTLSIEGAVTHSSSSNIVTGTTIIPEAFRPSYEADNVYFQDGTAICTIRVLTDGNIRLNYRNGSGTSINRTDNGNGGSVASIVTWPVRW